MKQVPHIGDLMAKPKPVAKPKDGPPPGRIAVIDAKGRYRGHVGTGGTAATAQRFGVQNAELRKHNGKPAWVGTRGK